MAEIAHRFGKTTDVAAHGHRSGPRHTGVPSRLFAYACLASGLLFVWQYVITRTLLENPAGSMALYYYGRGLMAAAIILFFMMGRRKTNCSSATVVPLTANRITSFVCGVLACVAPFVLVFFPSSDALAAIACLAAGVSSSWLYFEVFRQLARFPLQAGLVALLGMAALSQLLRPFLSFAQSPILPFIGLPLPLLSLVFSHTRLDSASAPEAATSSPNTSFGRIGAIFNVRLLVIITIEFALFGLVAGIVRTPYELLQFDITVSMLGAMPVAAAEGIFLAWVYHVRASVRLHSVTQISFFGSNKCLDC